MTPKLQPCSSCEQLVTVGTCVCPHCGVKKACSTLISRSAALLGLTATLSGGIGCVQNLYGVALPDTGFARDTGDPQLVDADGDGWNADDDCNDDDATVNPGATETVGDKLDSNCDGNDDT